MLACFKANNVRLVTYVPDKMLVPLIDGVHADDDFTALAATREEEAIGIAAGSTLAGMNSVVMMQSSGFGNCANALASLVVPFGLPVVLVITERGILGEYNLVQVPISRVIRPTLDALGIQHATLERADEVEFVTGRTIMQSIRTQAPSALILSPLLTGGKDD
jgi:sulfopyruvate decarboxylase alpha subunit